MGTSRNATSPSRAFATLEPRVRNVSAAAIRKKWKKLPSGQQNIVKQLLQSVKSQAMVATGKSAKLAQFESSVDEIANKLTHRLPRMPFPPTTSEATFDFEATLQRTRLLESQLSMNINSMNLLRAQITREERMLKQDQEDLEELRAGLRDSEAIRKKQNKSLHPVAQSLDADVEQQQYRPDTAETQQTDSLFELEKDMPIQPLLEQIRNHLESMDNNVAGFSDLADTLRSTQAVLSVFASHALDEKQYRYLHGLEVA